MDKDRQGFVELCDPEFSVPKQAGAFTPNLKGKKMHDICKNVQGVLKMIAHGKIKVDPEDPEIQPLQTYDRDLCQVLNNRRKCMERLRTARSGPQMSRSIASLANTALAHREELKEQGRWQAFLKGQDLRHIPPANKVAQEEDPQEAVMGEESPEE